MRLYLPQTTVSPLTLMRRQRILSAPGEILVQEGERVTPIQVIGYALEPGDFQIVNVAQSLGVPARSVRRYLKVQIGQEVKRGQILAIRKGLSRRVCRAPIAGRVTKGVGGRLLIEAPSKQVEIRAGYSGTVSRVAPGQGVAIQISGTLIQGVWGNNQESDGILRKIVDSPDDILEGQTIDASCRGMILIGGSDLDREAVGRAMEMQVRGIIVGGITPALLPEVERLLFPVMITEGIGPTPMSSRIFQLLSTQDGREAILDARFRSGREPLRPEVIVPLPAEPGTDRLQFRDVPLQTGDRVRAVRAPYTGLVGTVVDLSAVPIRTATDAYLLAVRVQPEGKGEPLLIPIANLEVLR